MTISRKDLEEQQNKQKKELMILVTSGQDS